MGDEVWRNYLMECEEGYKEMSTLKSKILITRKLKSQIIIVINYHNSGRTEIPMLKLLLKNITSRK